MGGEAVEVFPQRRKQKGPRFSHPLKNESPPENEGSPSLTGQDPGRNVPGVKHAPSSGLLLFHTTKTLRRRGIRPKGRSQPS